MAVGSQSAISELVRNRLRLGLGVAAKGVIIAIAAGVLATAGAIAMPGQAERKAAARSAPLRSPLAFTPAAADPRLAAAFARGGLDTLGLRFTPTETRRDNRAVTVVVRARTNRTEPQRSAALPATVGLAPIAYNLPARLDCHRGARLNRQKYFATCRRIVRSRT